MNNDEKNQHLKVWNSVVKTDPQYTKAYNLGEGESGTAINGTYYALRMTELYGPCGIGWGWKILEERYDETVPITIDRESESLVWGQTHTIQIKVWYKVKSYEHNSSPKFGQAEYKKYKLPPQFGHTRYRYKTNAGYIKVDSEAPKKSLTDAFKKSCSLLGIGGDIFLGNYDDVSYIKQMRDEFEIQNANDKDAAARKQWEEFNSTMEKNLECMEKAIQLNELIGIYSVSVKYAERRNDQDWVHKLKECKDRKKAELENKSTVKSKSTN